MHCISITLFGRSGQRILFRYFTSPTASQSKSSIAKLEKGSYLLARLLEAVAKPRNDMRFSFGVASSTSLTVLVTRNEAPLQGVKERGHK